MNSLQSLKQAVQQLLQVKHTCMQTRYQMTLSGQIISGKWKKIRVLKLLSLTIKGQREPEDFERNVFKNIIQGLWKHAYKLMLYTCGSIKYREFI